VAGTRVVAFSERLGLAATLDELAEWADPYRDHGHPGRREVALARRPGWPPAEGRREGKGLFFGLYLELSVKLVAPTGLEPVFPAPPHAFASESPICGAWAGDDREGMKPCQDSAMPHSARAASASRRRRPRFLDRCPKAEAIHGVNHLVDGHLRGVERDGRFFRSKAHIRATHTLQPFQGLLDRDGSGPSRHPLDCQHHGRGARQRGVSEHDCQDYGQPASDSLSHFMSSILCPEALP